MTPMPQLPTRDSIKRFFLLSGLWLLLHVTAVPNDQADTTHARYWTVATDNFRINDELPRLYLRWRWKAEKGLDYAEEFRLYERALDAKLSRDATPKPVALDMIQHPARPGIIIPAGSWPL